MLSEPVVAREMVEVVLVRPSHHVHPFGVILRSHDGEHAGICQLPGAVASS
jgi:hypothetical protein